MDKKHFNIVLVAPEIPGNTGSIGRTCVALGLRLILIRPYGFDLSEKAVRRAGLDYWKHVDITEYDSFKEFIREESVKTEELFLFENHKEKTHYDAGYKEGCYLVFGAETKGIPQEIMEQFSDRVVSLPQFSPHIRSLNLSNAATAAAYECLRCL